MTKEETTMTGFEIVSYSGDARSKLLTALAKAKEKKFDECDQLIEAAAECLKEAHDSQMDVMPVSYTHLRAHETDSYLVCRLLLEKKKNTNAAALAAEGVSAHRDVWI